VCVCGVWCVCVFVCVWMWMCVVWVCGVGVCMRVQACVYSVNLDFKIGNE